MQKFELEQVREETAGVVAEMDGKTLAEVIERYVDPTYLYDDKQDCFWQPESEDDKVRSAMVFELQADGGPPHFLGAVALRPGMTLDDVRTLYKEGDRSLWEDGFVTWLTDWHDCEEVEEAEGFVFVQDQED